jgi:hypothetical protein
VPLDAVDRAGTVGPPDGRRRPGRPRRGVSWRVVRGLRFAIVLVVAVAGILIVHLVFTATAPQAAPSAAVTVRPAGTRLLLAGSRLYGYDVGARALQTLQLPPDTPTALLRVLPVRGGEVVMTPGGQAYGAIIGRPLRLLGTFDGVVQDHDGDSVWLLTATTAQLSGVGGEYHGRPYQVPLGRRVVAALDAGLVLASTAPAGAGPVDVVNPASGRVVRAVAPLGVVLSAAGNHVAWERCGGRGCAVQVTQVSSGRTRPLPALPTGFVAVGPPRLSPDNRHYAVPVRQRPGGSVDLVVGRLGNASQADHGRVAVQRLLARPDAAQYARDGSLLVDTVTGLVLLRPGPAPSPTPLPKLPAFIAFAVS